MIIGFRQVEDGSGDLHVAPGDIVTPLARERAKELGRTIVVGRGRGRDARDGLSGAEPVASPRSTPGPPTAVAPGPLTPGPRPPLTGITYRRAGKVHGLVPEGVARTGGQGPRHGRAVCVGAGHVGTTAALRLAESGVYDEVVLVDVVDGLAAGTALDLWHGASIMGFSTRVRGTTEITDAGPADVYVVTAGRARQPGMTRADLAETNAQIIRSVATDIAAASPEAIVIVVTNPLDEMCDLMWRATGFPHRRVIGMAGQLDTARFRSLLALEPEVGDPAVVEALALGSHGAEMVIPLSQATVHGRPATEVVPRHRLDAVVERTRTSGGEVVGLLKSGSAYLTPGTAAAQMAIACTTNASIVFPCAVKPDGAYDLPDVHLGLPAELAGGGVERVVRLDLTADELRDLHHAAEAIEDRLHAMSA